MSITGLKPNADQQIIRAATQELTAKGGENIQRISEKIAKQIDGVTVDQVMKVVDQYWGTITRDAGRGQFAVTQFAPPASDTHGVQLRGTVAGQMLPHKPTTREVLTSAQMNKAGTLEARQLEKGDDSFVVQGPQYWDLMQHTKPFSQSKLSRIFDQATTFFGLDNLREKVSFGATKKLIDAKWSCGDTDKALRGISGSEIESLTKPGPHGEPPALQPGDALLCGGGGDGGLTHCILYAGLAPAGSPHAGEPMIIHAMATLKEGATRAEWLHDKEQYCRDWVGYHLGLTDKVPDGKTGVLYERLGDFFNRYHRDSILILRDPTLSDPAKIQQGIQAALKFTGYDPKTGKVDLSKRTPYDYKLAPDNLATTPTEELAKHLPKELVAKYCTEVYLAYNYAAHGGDRAKLPYVGTAFYNTGTPLGTIGIHDTFIAEPEDLAVSPDFVHVLTAGGGQHAVEEAQRLRLQPPIASVPRGERPVPVPIN